MSEIESLKVKDINGLQVQKCLNICKTAQKFESDIYMKHNNYKIDVKSILGLLSLACPQGETVELEAVGHDSKEAINALKEVIC